MLYIHIYNIYIYIYIYQGCTVPVRSGPFLDRTRSTIHVPVRSLILPVPVLPFRSLNAGPAGPEQSHF